MLALSRAGIRQAPRHVAAMSSVADVSVNITFLDFTGTRVTVPGRVGQNLLDLARSHGLDMEGACNGGGGVVERLAKDTYDPWNEDLFGEGPSCCSCHVNIASEWLDKIPSPSTKETSLLTEVFESDFRGANSRLGCQIQLTADLDGMIVSVPDGPPTDIP